MGEYAHPLSLNLFLPPVNGLSGEKQCRQPSGPPLVAQSPSRTRFPGPRVVAVAEAKAWPDGPPGTAPGLGAFMHLLSGSHARNLVPQNLV